MRSQNHGELRTQFPSHGINQFLTAIPPPARILERRWKRPFIKPITSSVPMLSCVLAGCTRMLIGSPSVSTAMCFLCPFIFFPSIPLYVHIKNFFQTNLNSFLVVHFIISLIAYSNP